MIVFRFDNELIQYKKLESIKKESLPTLLNSDHIFLFIDKKRYRIWIWQGTNTTIKMKFFSAKLVPTIRDKFGQGFKIIAVDEGNEPLGFKVMIGLEKEPDNLEVVNDPLYEGTEEDLELLESLRREKELLLRSRFNDL